jgi:sugar transferase (PEP-CTERM/EpsH1 system associated)
VTPLRILHVLSSLGLAGTEYGVVKTVNMLDPERFARWICCLGRSRPEVREAIQPEVQVVELNRRAPGIDWRITWRLSRLMRRERIQVVHSHNWSTFAYAVSSARMAGVPVVIHGEHGRDTASGSVSRRRRLLERLLAACTDHFTAVSQGICDHIRHDWGIAEDRVTLIPNGVDLTRFGIGYPRAQGLARLGLREGERLIGMVGEFRPIKDHMTLVRAFASVRRRIPGARLILVGYDAEDGFARRLRDEPLGDPRLLDDIRLVGLRTDVPEILSLLDVYVNCSLYEGMSNSILEAMASRKPVVATAVGGTPDIVEDGRTAWLVPPGDPEALADRLIQVLEDPEGAQQMGQRGRERVERFHSYAAMGETNARLYETLRARKAGDTRRTIE